MSKLFSKIDNLDLTSILSENEALDKLKESDGKYCRNCFTLFETEGDVCESCKSLLTEVTDFDRELVLAVKEVEDNLAIMGYSDITELDYDEQKELITDTLESLYGDRWDKELYNAIVRDFGLNTEKLCDSEEIEESEDEPNASIDDIQSKISDLKAGIEGLDKLEDVSDESTFELDGKEYTKSKANGEIRSLTNKLEKLSKEKNGDLENAFGDNKLTEEENGKTFEQWFNTEYDNGGETFEEYCKSFPSAETLKDATAADIRANAANFYDVYPVDSADREKAFIFASEDLGIDYDELYNAWLGKNESENLSEDTTQIDLALDALTEIESVIETEGSIDQELTISKINTALEALEDSKYDEAKKPLQNILDIIAEERSIDQDIMLSNVESAMDILNRMALNESIMTTTTVDNIDQESKDKKTIDKAIEIAGDKNTIDNDTFRQLRLELANKDYDVLDRLKDYALVRGEEVIYTWLRAEDTKDNLKESEILVTDIDWETDGADVDLPKDITIPVEELDIEDINDEEEVNEVLNNYLSNNYDFLVNSYLYELKESVNISIVDNNINIDTDDNVNITTGETNINIDTTSNEAEPALDMSIEPVEEIPADEVIVDEPVTDVALDEPETEEVLDDTKMIKDSEIKEGVMIGKDNVSVEELEAIFANGDESKFTGKDWENELYNIYFSDEIWDTLDSNADQVISADTIKDMIATEINEGIYNADSETLRNLAQVVGAEVKITNEAEELIENSISYQEIVDMMEAAEDYIDLYNAANKISDPAVRKSVEEALDTCENDGDSVEEACSIVSSDILSYQAANESEEKPAEDEDIIESDGLQVDDIPAKIDQDKKNKRIELAKLESEDKVTYRVSYLKEDDEEIAGWDIEADNDEDAIEALQDFADADTIVDDLLSAEFVSTGIDGISSLNYKNTNILLSTDDNENIITINQDNEEPVIIKGETFDEVMNQLIYWFIMNLDEESEVEETEVNMEVEGE